PRATRRAEGSGGSRRLRDRGSASCPRRSSLERAAVVALVIVAVGPRADRLPPPSVVAVPPYGALESLVEPHARFPAERVQLVRAQRVAAIVPGPIGDELDQRFVHPAQLDDPLDDVEVLALVGSAAVVDL